MDQPWAHAVALRCAAITDPDHDAGALLTGAEAGHAADGARPFERARTALAAGLSNRDIGERLFLSPRTVGYHLYKSFPKLGVSTRAQLAHLRLPPPEGDR